MNIVKAFRYGFAAIAALAASSLVAATTDFKKQFDITLNAALTETEITTGVPALVRLSESTIPGFDYDDFSSSAGADMMFTDSAGNELPYEIDTWNPSGESLVWVRLPSTAANTVIRMYYGNGATPTATATSVWSDYVGVWHLNGTNATDTADSFGEYPNSTATAGINGNLASNSIANATGKFGKAFRVNDVTTARSGNYNYGGVWVPGADALKLGSTFAISGWFKNGASALNYDHLFYKRSAWNGTSGFAIETASGTAFTLVARGYASNKTDLTVTASPFEDWVYLTFAYDGSACHVYANGALVGDSTIDAVTDNSEALVFGNNTSIVTNGVGDCAWSGWIDECRIMDSVPDGNAVAAEYAAQNGGDADIFTYAVAASTDTEMVRFASVPALECTADGLRVTVTVSSSSVAGAVYAVCGTESPYAYRSVLADNAQPGETVSGLITNMPADSVCGFGVLGVSSADETKTTTLEGSGTFCSGTVTVEKGADASEEYPTVPGTFTVSRPAGAASGALVVNYTLGGTAVAGTDYQALSGTVTIPDGETSATVSVYPIVTRTQNHTLTLTIAPGRYVASSDSATITIKKFDPTDGFAKKVTFTLDGYSGATVADIPVLVRLSESAIDGFAYADCQLANGGDIRFVDSEGNKLPCEVETWNAEGESLVWVRVPEYKAGLQLTMVYGTTDPWTMASADTWSDYAGVYHFDETEAGAQTVADSSGNSDGTSHAKSLVMAGVLGNARGRTDATGKNGATMTVPLTTALDNLVPTFTVSGWVYPTTASADWGYVFSRKNADGYKSWGWQFRSSSSLGSIGIYSSGTSDNDSNRNVFSTSVFAANTWVKYDVVYTSTQVSLYLNGTLVATQTIKPTGGAVNGSLDFTVGGLNDSGYGTMKGYFDEMRLRYGEVSADFVAAEYAIEKGTASFTNEGAADVDASSVKFDGKASVTKDGDAFKLSATTSADSGTGTIRAAYGTGGDYSLVDVATTASAVSTTYTVTLTQLAADTTYRARAEGVNDKGTVTKVAAGEVFYNGTLAIAAGGDAEEKELSTPATVTVSRADTYGDLVVNYAVGGTAVSGTNYRKLSGTVTIPDGAASANIEIYPLRAKDGDHSVTITIADGLYLLPSEAASATVTIKTLIAPEGYNTWIANTNSLASIADNWSEGRVPASTDNILLDGRYSDAALTWDAGENGLSDTVASWTQNENYTNIVTIMTTYPGKGDFETFTVTGACTIDGGIWTHPQSRTTWDWVTDYVADLKANETYRINLVCGSLTVGANARIDAMNKGYYQANSGSVTLGAPAHGGMCATSAMSPYGDPKEPTHIGLGVKPASGNYTVGIGGGAIYIVVDGAATVNGTIKADTGSDPWSRGLTLRGGAAAGSVYLKAASVVGTGTISASARATDEQNGRGCGGRVAVIATGAAVDRTALTLAATVYPYKSGTSESSSYGSCGTVYVLDTTTGSNGMLIIDNQTSMPTWGMDRAVTIPSADGDGTFDKLALGHKAVLALPVGSELHLPNGLASVSSLNDASSTAYGSIRYEGGTFDIGTATDQTMSGSWMLTGSSNLVLTCNLTVQDGAAIGVPSMSSVKDDASNADVSARTLKPIVTSTVTVNGNLNVTPTGKLVADYCGFVKRDHNNPSQYLGVLGYGNHGGRHKARGAGDYLAPTNFYYKGYDSAFAPAFPGCSGWYGNGSSAAGGAMKLVVSGALTLDGAATANGSPVTSVANSNDAGGPGGSIDITAGSISGSGTIDANGGSISSTQGGGGRVAIKLTGAGADFSNFATANINASGRYYNGASSGRESSSAGTVYLQTAGEGDKRGSVLVKCKLSSGYYSASNTNTTEMVSLGYGGDAVADYKRVKYVISDYGRAAANTDLTAASVNIATTNAFVDLEGHTLTVKKFAYVQDKEGVSVSKKLSGGTYGGDTLPDCVYDSVGGGALIVTGGGFALVVR